MKTNDVRGAIERALSLLDTVGAEPTYVTITENLQVSFHGVPLVTALDITASQTDERDLSTFESQGRRLIVVTVPGVEFICAVTDAPEVTP